MNEPRPRTEADLIELVRSSDVRAPEALHRRVESLIAERSQPRRRAQIRGGSPAPGRGWLARRLAGAGALAAAAVVALAVLLSGGGSAGLSLHEATALTLSAAKAPAPPESAGNRDELVAAVEGVHFPYWNGRFGWRSTGQRSDRVAGRTVTTVFYANAGGQRIGYAIVAGTPAPRVGGGAIDWNKGTPYRLLRTQGAQVVTWLRNGRLCVLSGHGISGATLLALASWGEDGSAA
jgi:hypothetical protein